VTITAFPPVELADEDGLLCIGGDLEAESLLLAYRSGIFPWPYSENEPLLWFAPPQRAIVFLERFHVPRSLARQRRKENISFRIDSQFEEVIRRCAMSPNRRNQNGTWITSPMIQAYINLYHAGWCHSIECYRDESLIGGLYGISIGTMFAGESMFYLEDGGSKLALWHLAELLQAAGATWFDCQQLTPLLASFGAEEIPRQEFTALLKTAVSSPDKIFARPLLSKGSTQEN
jgi:leucyl/phenylalanyl-tRNA--protein transferase